MFTPEILAACLPEASSDNVALYAESLNNACEEFSITTIFRSAAFIAQVGHESGSLKYVKENLNYSDVGLRKIFPKYFTESEAKSYARNPEAIANRVYASRMGNGDENSGDGWTFRGRGLIQLTGYENYMKCAKALGIDESFDPQYFETPEGAARSAGWFWKFKALNPLADSGDMKEITRRINGGFHGLEDRMLKYRHALSILNKKF